ncbi:MAG TPA: type VI secretion system-associated FHA domain protein TagH [Plasticicumulans sp.]|nr:type VI secretion system-associated FHA domain protein TagH [Plasticicumulans sp.]
MALNEVAAVAAVTAALCAAPSAWALSLGRLTVQSALGEALKAEIDVTSLTPDEAANLRVRIAPPDSYRIAGVDYNPVLPATTVSVQRRADGTAFLRILSDRAVQEPFVDVILELSWSSGRLLREYTLLFDPPSSPRSPAVPAPATPAGPATAEAGGDPFGLLAPAPLTSAPVPDHVPSEQQAFVPPAPVSDDDWDALFPAPAAAGAAPVRLDIPPAAKTPDPLFAGLGPLAEESAPPAAPPPDETPAVPAFTPAPVSGPVPAPAPAPVPVPAPAPAIPAAAAPAAELMAALLEGAGLAHLQIPQARQADLLRALGDSYRRMVEGLMTVLRARSHVKGEFRMQQTSIRPIENNPLKFAPNVEEAMTLLLTLRSQSYLSPERAVAEAFEDLQAHQLAMMAGMQAALGHLFRRFDPATLEARFGSGGLLPGSRKARCWEQFTALYQDIAREAEDDFQELFGREFVRAYEEQIARLRSR